jgi:pyruvate ferredoxin oxidoreductase gamma subunit
MDELMEIRWHGRGGQGVVTAGKLLAETALETGQYFQAFPDYGPERMGAPIRAFTRLSPKPIRVHSQIDAPKVVLVLDPTLLDQVPVAEGLAEDGVMIVNTAMPPSDVRAITGFATGSVLKSLAERSPTPPCWERWPAPPVFSRSMSWRRRCAPGLPRNSLGML